MQDVSGVANALRRIVEISAGALVSEEDVKIKIVLPILRALGYDDNDFKYEGRTGRGYVDVVVEHYPTGIIIESKSPRKKLDNYIEQLETYIFHKHGRDRITVAILTDGDKFNVYGITGALYKGSLEDFRILSFARTDLVSTTLLQQVLELLGKQSNQDRAIGDAIAGHRKHQERLRIIDSELRSLIADRERIDSRIGALETERTGIVGFSGSPSDKPKVIRSLSSVYKFPASGHIVTLLRDSAAFSQSQGIHRKILDERLINKVEGVQTQAAVSHGIIEVTNKGIADHEGGKNSGRSIGKVWLLETREKSAI